MRFSQTPLSPSAASRYSVARTLLASILATLGLVFVSPCVFSAEPPNIVFILTDDQGYGDLDCYGSKDIATPNIDQLCAEGMKFTSFYVHNRCSPTRAALMTGCHAQRVGVDNVVYRREKIGLNTNEITVAELLKTAGYATGIVGKWHLGEWDVFNPVNHGFDSFFGFMECDDKKNNRNVSQHGNRRGSQTQDERSSFAQVALRRY